MTIRVALVDDQELVRTGLAMVIDAHEDMRVVAQAGDGAQALAMLAATHADSAGADGCPDAEAERRGRHGRAYRPRRGPEGDLDCAKWFDHVAPRLANRGRCGQRVSGRPEDFGCRHVLSSMREVLKRTAQVACAEKSGRVLHRSRPSLFLKHVLPQRPCG